MSDHPEGPDSGRFDLAELAARFPDSAETMLLDQYIRDRPEASVRVFRPYRPVPPHHHTQCDECLYVFSGRGTFWMGDPSTEAEFGPGQLIVFPRGTVHSLPRLIEQPIVFLAIDTPRRDPSDVVFQNPEDAKAAGFIKAVGY